MHSSLNIRSAIFQCSTCYNGSLLNRKRSHPSVFLAQDWRHYLTENWWFLHLSFSAFCSSSSSKHKNNAIKKTPEFSQWSNWGQLHFLSAVLQSGNISFCFQSCNFLIRDDKALLRGDCYWESLVYWLRQRPWWDIERFHSCRSWRRRWEQFVCYFGFLDRRRYFYFWVEICKFPSILSNKRWITVMCTINERGDCVIDVLKFLKVLCEVEVVFVDVQLSKMLGGMRG